MVALAIALMADPVLVGVGDWLCFQKTAKGWATASPSLSGRSVLWSVLPGGAKVEGLCFFEEGPPAGAATVKVDRDLPEGALLVSGGKWVEKEHSRPPLDHGPLNASALAFVKGHGLQPANVVLQDVLRCDLDGDGAADTLVAAGTGSTATEPQEGDFSTAFVMGTGTGKHKTTPLFWDTKFGEMRGPFQTRFYPPGDYDGDGATEFVVKTSDSWTSVATLYRLTRQGEATKLATAAFGE